MVTDQQVRRLFQMSRDSKLNKSQAAIKSGMDEKTARKYLTAGKLPSELKTGWATPNLATTDQALESHRGSTQRGLFPPGASSWCLKPIWFYSYVISWYNDQRATLWSFAVSFCTDLFQLGDRQHLFLWEFWIFEWRVAECSLDTGWRTGYSSDRQVICSCSKYD